MAPRVLQKQQYRNRVLARLPAVERQQLSGHLAPMTFKSNHNLHEPGMMIDTIYFLEDAIASVVVTMQNGSTVEVGLIGRDGVVGLSAVMGTGRSTNRTFIQVPGSGFMVKAKVIREQFET